MSAVTGLTYWEERAQRFARHGDGLRAVCSYGMPWFYNGFIHLTQWLALRRWLKVAPGATVLDVGCGIGRWSRMMARRGAKVTGADLSPIMIEEARRRTQRAGLSCRFVATDLATLELRQRYTTIVGVTVLQHIMEDQRLAAAVSNLARHLAPGGRLVLLEAAPSRQSARCDSAIFRARAAVAYRQIFEQAGLRCVVETGVDPAPLKTLYLPFHRSLPPILANLLLFAVTIASIPIDALLGRVWSGPSWHKVFVLEHRSSHPELGNGTRADGAR